MCTWDMWMGIHFMDLLFYFNFFLVANILLDIGEEYYAKESSIDSLTQQIEGAIPWTSVRGDFWA